MLSAGQTEGGDGLIQDPKKKNPQPIRKRGEVGLAKEKDTQKKKKDLGGRKNLSREGALGKSTKNGEERVRRNRRGGGGIRGTSIGG